MKFKINDYVSRKSYKNDIIFKIINIEGNKVYLKGYDIRLYADSFIDDLVHENKPEDREKYIDRIEDKLILDRNNYFYLPGKILHLDGDIDYLNRCLEFYKEAGIYAIGKNINESSLSSVIERYLKEYSPDIVVITGHDAYHDKNGNKYDNNNYQNSTNFINSVKKARRYEKSHDKLIIIAGACQSNYEELIKAGANYASSPKRINIHALDPAIIASTIALSDRNKQLDLIKLLERTKYGHNGIGGIIGNGVMYVGYPR